MYNSGANEGDETDYTMIAGALEDDPHFRPRLPQTRQHMTDGFHHVDSSLPDWIKEFEQILEFYRDELKPESNSQSHVHHQFLLRLIDLIRPHYHNNQKKLDHFDKLFQDIIELYERETVKQREKTEELQRETAHWQRCSLISSHEPRPRENVKLFNDDLTELTQSIEQLQQILEAQQTRIKELTELISVQPAPPARVPDLVFPPAETGMLDPHNQNLRLLSRQISNTRERRCTICRKLFSRETNEDEIMQHLFACTKDPLEKSSCHRPVENQYSCPVCHENLDSSNEQAYLEHLRECYAVNSN